MLTQTCNLTTLSILYGQNCHLESYHYIFHFFLFPPRQTSSAPLMSQGTEWAAKGGKKRTFGTLTQNFRFKLPRLQTSWFRELPRSRAALAASLPPDMSALSAVGVPAASCVDSRVIAISICHMKGEESGVPFKKKKKTDET